MTYYGYADGGVFHNQTPSKRKAYISFKIFDSEDKKNFVVHYNDSLNNSYTNNQAEYIAITRLLNEFLAQFNAFDIRPTHLKVFTDSQLVVNQLKGEFKVKSDNIRTYYDTLKKIILNFPVPIEIEWISRTEIVKILGH